MTPQPPIAALPEVFWLDRPQHSGKQPAVWLSEWRKLRAYTERQKGELAAAHAEVERLEAELESLRAFKRNVDEALNSGDGVYRP